jgi:hypothetical protein
MVKEEISRQSTQYSKRLSTHPNELTLSSRTSKKVATLTTSVNSSAHQIHCVIVVVVNLVIKD